MNTVKTVVGVAAGAVVVGYGVSVAMESGKTKQGQIGLAELLSGRRRDSFAVQKYIAQKLDKDLDGGAKATHEYDTFSLINQSYKIFSGETNSHKTLKEEFIKYEELCNKLVEEISGKNQIEIYIIRM
ncbi:MAG: hypothetical protein ACK5Z5_00595 [Neisseriaceae bacterium]